MPLTPVDSTAINNNYCLAALPAWWLLLRKQGHFSPKACSTVFYYISQRRFWAHGNLFRNSLRTWSLKVNCPYCEQTYKTYDKIKNHIGIHIMRKLRNLVNLSPLFQPGRVTWTSLSHEHFSMNRLWTNLSILPATC